MALYDNPAQRAGYQPFTRQTFAPLQQPYQFSDSFQGKPSSAAPSDTHPSIPSSSQGESGVTPRPASGLQPSPHPTYTGQGYQTFAQMQAAGVPRPAPPTPPMGFPSSGASAPGNPVGDALQQSVLGGLNNPSAFNSDIVQQTFNRLSGAIDDKYSEDERRTNEQLAGRGLYDSTEAAGRLHDLNVGRRSAKTNLADSLLTQQAQTYGQDRASAIASALGLTGQQNQYALGQNSQLINLLNALGAAGFLGDPSQIAGLLGGQ